MGDAAVNVVQIGPRITQRRLRMMAFARIFAETMDSGQAYRDVYRPATNPKDTDKLHGDKLLRTDFVQKHVGILLKPALVALGVDQAFALRRLIETIDGDITDYVKPVVGDDDVGTTQLMTLEDIRDTLPLGKRRLIRKYEEKYDKDGNLRSRGIELEPKQPALELLARIRGWIKSDTNLIVNGDLMLQMIDQARAAGIDKSAALRGEFVASKTYSQLSRPEPKQLEAPKQAPDAEAAVPLAPGEVQ